MLACALLAFCEKVWKEEVFGPVMTLTKFKTIDEVSLSRFRTISGCIFTLLFVVLLSFPLDRWWLAPTTHRTAWRAASSRRMPSRFACSQRVLLGPLTLRVLAARARSCRVASAPVWCSGTATTWWMSRRLLVRGARFAFSQDDRALLFAGGFKQSGFGREGGEYGLLPYLEVKNVVQRVR